MTQFSCSMVCRSEELRDSNICFSLHRSRGEEHGCDFFRWCDEPRDLGPMQLDLTDLVDNRYRVETDVKALSVRMGLVKYTEAAYYLNVIAFETESKHHAKQGEVGIHGSLIQSSSRGTALSADEEMLVQVFKALPYEQELTLQAFRQPRCGRAPLSRRRMNQSGFERVCLLAEKLGLAKMEQRREGRGLGRMKTVLVKKNKDSLSAEARRAMDDLKLPHFIFCA